MGRSGVVPLAGRAVARPLEGLGSARSVRARQRCDRLRVARFVDVVVSVVPKAVGVGVVRAAALTCADAKARIFRQQVG